MEKLNSSFYSQGLKSEQFSWELIACGEVATTRSQQGHNNASKHKGIAFIWRTSKQTLESTPFAVQNTLNEFEYDIGFSKHSL